MTRKMGCYDIIQRTQDGYFDANYLLHQWNGIPEHTKRRMDDFLSSASTKEFADTIIKREGKNIQPTDNEVMRKNAIPDYQVVIKGRVKTLKDGSKIPACVWMHPLLFIDFAMWINPSFKYDVLKFVHDELIKYRHEAGDSFREMSGAICKIVSGDAVSNALQEIAKALNYIVFNAHETYIRNKADEPKIREYCELEKDISKLINFGFIKSLEELKSHLRKIWASKWSLPTLAS